MGGDPGEGQKRDMELWGGGLPELKTNYNQFALIPHFDGVPEESGNANF